MIKFEKASIVTCFDNGTIGTKVTCHESDFLSVLAKAVEDHDPSKDEHPGQHFVVMPEGATRLVSAGVAKRTENPDHYVPRFYRGEVTLFMRREHAVECTGVACIVYTMKAYLRDPQVSDEEAKRLGAYRGGLREERWIYDGDATHVLVAVLGFGGPKPKLSPGRFVANLAGGNRNTEELTGDEIRKQAREIIEHANEWCTVAD